MPCSYEQKTFHIMRNLSSWGMHQLEIFNKKKHLFPKRCTLQGIRDSHVAEKLTDTECYTLVYMNTSRTI